MAKQYRKKPVVIEAIQFKGFSGGPDSLPKDIMDFLGDNPIVTNEEGNLLLHTLEGIMTARVGDWIIKGIKGEFYPCKPDIFEATYNDVNTKERSLENTNEEEAAANGWKIIKPFPGEIVGKAVFSGGDLRIMKSTKRFAVADGWIYNTSTEIHKGDRVSVAEALAFVPSHRA